MYMCIMAAYFTLNWLGHSCNEWLFFFLKTCYWTVIFICCAKQLLIDAHNVFPATYICSNTCIYIIYVLDYVFEYISGPQDNPINLIARLSE